MLFDCINWISVVFGVEVLENSKEHVITLTYLLLALVIMFNVDYFIYEWVLM
ncbi:hypothetical protein ACFWDG_23725 [Peribacillus sp. NPDC060186]